MGSPRGRTGGTAAVAGRRATVERQAVSPIARQIGQRLRFARQAAGMQNQADLAARLGVAQSTVYRWEAGERIPRVQQQIAICRALGQSHEFLFGFVVAP